MIDLAVAARERAALPAPLDAMARRHEAQGHAMAGAEDMCHRRLEESAESPETPDDDLPYMVDYPAGLPTRWPPGASSSFIIPPTRSRSWSGTCGEPRRDT